MAKPANLFVPASFAACTNTTSEVVMGTVTIPAFFLRSPYKLGISYAVQTPSTNSSDTFVPRVKVNSIVAATLGGLTSRSLNDAGAPAECAWGGTATGAAVPKGVTTTDGTASAGSSKTRDRRSGDNPNLRSQSAES